MKRCVPLFPALVFSFAFFTAPAVANAPAQPLTSGTNVERTLTPPGQDDYSIFLDSGAAVVAEVDQEGIDVVIDVYGPDGTRLSRLDSPNGSQGPEPIDVTALTPGTYTFSIHTLDASAKPGKYVIKDARIYSAGQNAQRLAKQNYTAPGVYELWLASQTDPGAAAAFMAERKKNGPIVEPYPANPALSRVTFAYMGDRDTEVAFLYGGPDFGGVRMRRVGKTDVFIGSELVPPDARYYYSFAAVETHHAGPNGEVAFSEIARSGPELLEMPEAPAQPYIIAKPGVPQGKLLNTSLASATLKETRQFSVYTPPGYSRATPCNLVIVFDGEVYGAQPQTALVPVPIILDNLLSEKKIGPTIAILVDAMTTRSRDLNGSPPFAAFIAKELVPWVRQRYNIRAGPGAVAAAGSSSGGFAAAYAAYFYPGIIGNVISQSGAYWITKDWQKVTPPYPRDTGFLIESYRKSKRLPIRFYMDVGRYDLGAALLGSNRDLRDVLLSKGYEVHYQEFDGGHEYVQWRGTFSDGLLAIFGATSPCRSRCTE